MEKCADLLVPLLRLPTTDGVTGLQLMAWCEYALNSESGFWSYTGLAIRMSEDLGFHKDTEEIFEDSGHYVRNKLLFWSLFVTDRLVSFATGRVCSMKEDVIELPLPTDEDMIPRPTPEGTDTTPRPSPFVALVKLMVICGRMSDVLNGNRGAPRTFMPSPPPHLREKITAVQDDLEAFYNNLPPALQWSAATYKHFVSIGQGGVFLTLHCHANALLTLFARPTILFGHDDDAPELSIRSAFKESDRVSLASSRLIAECIVYSDLHSSISYMASPHITQSLYIAGVAFIKEMSAVEPGLRTGDIVNKPGGANEAFLYMVASQNLDIIFKALKKIESVWMGAGVSAYVLSQRAKGELRCDQFIKHRADLICVRSRRRPNRPRRIFRQHSKLRVSQGRRCPQTFRRQGRFHRNKSIEAIKHESRSHQPDRKPRIGSDGDEWQPGALARYASCEVCGR